MYSISLEESDFERGSLKQPGNIRPAGNETTGRGKLKESFAYLEKKNTAVVWRQIDVTAQLTPENGYST